MEKALKNLSKEELLELVSTQTLQISLLSKEHESLSRDSSVKDEKIDLLTSERDILSQERDYLKAQVEMLKRMQFGQSRERFEGDPNQTALPFEAEPAEAEQQQQEVKEKIEKNTEKKKQELYWLPFN